MSYLIKEVSVDEAMRGSKYNLKVVAISVSKDKGNLNVSVGFNYRTAANWVLGSPGEFTLVFCDKVIPNRKPPEIAALDDILQRVVKGEDQVQFDPPIAIEEVSDRIQGNFQ